MTTNNNTQTAGITFKLTAYEFDKIIGALNSAAHYRGLMWGIHVDKWTGKGGSFRSRPVFTKLLSDKRRTVAGIRDLKDAMLSAAGRVGIPSGAGVADRTFVLSISVAGKVSAIADRWTVAGKRFERIRCAAIRAAANA